MLVRDNDKDTRINAELEKLKSELLSEISRQLMESYIPDKTVD